MKKITFIAISFLIIGFLLPKTVFGIGQVTKPIVIENALRGQEVIASLAFINSKDSEAIYGLMAEGDIAEWTTFYTIEDADFKNPVTEIKISPATTQNAVVKFTVPDDQPNGTYTGKVYVFDAPKNSSEADKKSINVGQRIGRNVSITVSAEEIIKLESLIIPLTYEVKKGESLQIKIIHNNLGNIAVKPSFQLRATRDGKEVFNAIFPYPESEKAIKPLERKTMPLVEWQTTGLEEGKYLIEMKVLLNNMVVKKIDHGLTIGQIAFQNAIGSYKNWIITGLAGIFAIMFMIYGFFIVKKKRIYIKKTK